MGQGSLIFLSRCKPTFFYSSTFHRIDTCLNMFPWFAWDTDRRERPNLSGLRIGTDKEPLLVHYTWNILCFVFASTPYCIYRLGFGFSFFRGVGLCPLPRQSKFTKIYRIGLIRIFHSSAKVRENFRRWKTRGWMCLRSSTLCRDWRTRISSSMPLRILSTTDRFCVWCLSVL